LSINKDLQNIIDKNTNNSIEEAVKLLEPYVTNVFRNWTRDPEYQGLVGPTIWTTLSEEGVSVASIPKCIQACRYAMIQHTTSVVRVPRSSANLLKETGRHVPASIEFDVAIHDRTPEDSKFEALLDDIRNSDLGVFEVAVLKALLNGKSQTDIASACNKSTSSISRVVTSIREKLKPIVADHGYSI
jgi:hypothetical protein